MHYVHINKEIFEIYEIYEMKEKSYLNIYTYLVCFTKIKCNSRNEYL
jgi:hypothetical protein